MTERDFINTATFLWEARWILLPTILITSIIIGTFAHWASTEIKLWAWNRSLR